MKKIVILLILAVTAINSIAQSEKSDNLIDKRDGRNYKTVKIGAQTWMAENLAYLPKVNPPDKGHDSGLYYYVYDYQGSMVSEAKTTSNYNAQGVLYSWQAAKTACPSGWHLPNDEDWKILEKYLGMNISDIGTTELRNSGDVGKKLKSTSGWNNNGNGDNSSGFNAIPSGQRLSFGYAEGMGAFYNGEGLIAFWTSLESDQKAWFRALLSGGGGVIRDITSIMEGLSVRCIKDK